MNFQITDLKYNQEGLIPVIIQEASTNEVLMLAYMNEDSLAQTMLSGKTCFWSRSRQKYWTKGETSGHVQHVLGIYYDCDKDTLLIKVEQVGAACHEGYKSCFFTEIKEGNIQIVAERLFDPKEVYNK